MLGIGCPGRHALPLTHRAIVLELSTAWATPFREKVARKIRLRGVWRYRCRQVVTAERHLYGDRDPVLETSKLPDSAGDRWFESISLQRRVNKLSVPLKTTPVVRSHDLFAIEGPPRDCCESPSRARQCRYAIVRLLVRARRRSSLHGLTFDRSLRASFPSEFLRQNARFHYRSRAPYGPRYGLLEGRIRERLAG
jgi:hypothetical protein